MSPKKLVAVVKPNTPIQLGETFALYDDGTWTVLVPSKLQEEGQRTNNVSTVRREVYRPTTHVIVGMAELADANNFKNNKDNELKSP